MALRRYILTALLLVFSVEDGAVAVRVKNAQRTKCQRYTALRKFSSCGSAVSLAAREKTLLEKPNHNATCERAKDFEKCFQESMHTTRCQRSSEFSFHLLHISKLVNEMYKESCSITGESSTVLSDMSTVCDIRVAVVRFLECASSFYSTQTQQEPASTKGTTLAVHFGIMFDAPSSGAKLASFECRRNHKFKNCIENIHLYSECGVGTEVHSHLKYLAAIVHRRFAGKCSLQALHGAPEVTEIECELIPFLRKFLRCGVDRYENAEDVLQQDICGKVAVYKDCLLSAETTTHCRMRNLSLSYHLEYLYKLMTATNGTCRATKRIETSTYKQACKRTTLFNNFFSCGTEVQSQLEGLKKGDKEKCRISENFEKCFISAREQSGCLRADDSTSIMSSLLDTWKKERDKECAQYNAPSSDGRNCLTGPAVKRVFLCGLNFQTAVREVKYTPMDMSPAVCKHLDDLNACISDVKNGTACALSELHAHVAPLLQPFTMDYTERCDKIKATANQSSSFLSRRASQGCRRLAAVKKIFHCGLSFSKILEEMQLVHQKADVLCPLLKKYEMCVPDSAAEVGCSDDPVMKGHVKAFAKILRGQYYDSCVQGRRSSSSKSGQRRLRSGPRSRTRDILGNAKVLKQEMKNMRQVLSNITRDAQPQVVEDYYGSDYEDYIEEDDKIPDSLDVKPAYDYVDHDTTRKTMKTEQPKTTARHGKQTSSAVSNSRPGPDVKKMQHFWADLEDARKMRPHHEYGPGSLSYFNELPGKKAMRDLSKPGAYFIDELAQSSAGGNDIYVAGRPQVNGARSVFRKGPSGIGMVQNSPVLKRLSRTAMQGESDYSDYNYVDRIPSSREKELEMYEDNRGMAEMLRKERDMGYRHYSLRDGPRHAHTLQRVENVAMRRYPGEDDVVYIPGRHSYIRELKDDDGLRDRPAYSPRYNKSYDDYDLQDGYNYYPRDSRGLRPLYRPNIRYDPRNGGRTVQNSLDARHLPVHEGMNVIPQRGRARAFRNTDHEVLGEYKNRESDKVSGESAVKRGAFPDDDAPILPMDGMESRDGISVGSRRLSQRRRSASNVLGPARDLEAPRDVVNVEAGEVPPVIRKQSTVNAVRDKRYPGHGSNQDHVPPYPSGEGRSSLEKPGIPVRPPPSRLSEDYDDRGDVGDYSDLLMKVDSEHRQKVVDNDHPVPQFAVKHIDSKERMPAKKNPKYYVEGGEYLNSRKIQRIPGVRNYQRGEGRLRNLKKRPAIIRPSGGAHTYPGDEAYRQMSIRNESRLREPLRPLRRPEFSPDDRPGRGSERKHAKEEDGYRETALRSSGAFEKEGRNPSIPEYPNEPGSRSMASEENFYNPSPKRFLDIRKRRRDKSESIPYVKHIEDTPGLLLDKADENSGMDIAHAQPHSVHAKLTPYEIERKRKNKLLKDDMYDTFSKHKEESLSKEDAFLFQDEKVGHEEDERLVGDIDSKAFEDSKDYSELDAKLAGDTGYKGPAWEGGGDDEEMLRNHVKDTSRKKDTLIEELGKKSSWYTDPIWNDKNDLFGMERLLSEQKGPGQPLNETEDDDKNQCQQQYLERRSENCLRIFEDDFKAVGSNWTTREFRRTELTPALVKSVCLHARKFTECIDLFAQKFRCAESEIIRNLTEAHLRKAGVVFCRSCSLKAFALLAYLLLLVHLF